MSVKLNASTTSGLVVDSDLTGSLKLQTSGNDALTVDSSQVVNFTKQFQIGGVLPPAFSAYNSSSTTLNTTTWTKIALQTEVFDTNSYFDNSTNYRFTPLVAGYYQINGAVSTNNPAGSLFCAIYKNGSQLYKSQVVPANASLGTNSTVSGVVYFNGSTDYVELYGYQSNGSAQTTYANSYDTYFNGCMIRGV